MASQQRLLEGLGAAGATGGYIYEEAHAQFARAYAELSKDRWLAKSEPEQIARLRELGGC